MSSKVVEAIYDSTLGETVLIATHDLGSNVKIIALTGRLHATRDRHTIERYPGQHLVLDSIARYAQHSCNPNCEVAFEDPVWSFKSIRPIRAGEMISFNYNTTEFNMECPFDCLCGEVNCYKRVCGFKHLNEHQQRQIMHMISPSVRQQLFDN